jgi:hypothetical protein
MWRRPYSAFTVAVRNPFDAINQLMEGKIAREDWVARCREFGISALILLLTPGTDRPADPSKPTSSPSTPPRRSTGVLAGFLLTAFNV